MGWGPGSGEKRASGGPSMCREVVGVGGASAGHLAAVTPPPRLHRVGEGGNDPNFRRQDGKDILLFLQGFSARACIFPDVRLGFPRGRASHPPHPAPSPHTCSLSDGEGSVVPALSPWPLPSREGTPDPPRLPTGATPPWLPVQEVGGRSRSHLSPLRPDQGHATRFPWSAPPGYARREILEA